jgi:hypothetical protein
MTVYVPGCADCSGHQLQHRQTADGCIREAREERLVR